MYEKLKQLSISKLHSLVDFYIIHYKLITFICTVIFLGLIVILSRSSADEIRKIVIDDFNNQQLILARHSASQITNTISTLKREISLLAFSPTIQYLESVQLYRRMGITFSSNRDNGLLEIRLISRLKKQNYIVRFDGTKTEYSSRSDIELLESLDDEDKKDRIFLSDISFKRFYGQEKMVINMYIPVWQVSVDDAHPIATNNYAGVLLFVIDVKEVITNVVKNIKSGKTGYSWVIDNKGIFLYHPETDFIGKNAFEARQKKKPTISFSKINQIQQEMILKGQEGTSSYISGWHREEKDKIIEKLIAYAPIFLTGNETDPEQIHWSIAVVAPVSEIDGTIKGIQNRQLLIQATVIIVTVTAGWLIVGILLRWSSTIKKEVDEKTRELTRSEYQWRSLIEHATDLIYTMSAEGVILSMNNYGFKFLDKTFNEVIGKSIFEIFTKDVATSHMKIIRDVIETGKPNQAVYQFMENDFERWVNVSFSGLLDEWGNVYKVLAIGRDITMRINIEKQMSHTEKLASVGTLSAGIAHEINNPLAIILGFTDILLEKFPDGSEEKQILLTIQKHGLNAKKIVENLLGFARYTEHVEKDVDINQNIQSVLDVISNNLAINKITLSTDFKKDLPTIQGDPGELQQVFFNIISNAIAAMKKGGKLSVSTRLSEDNNFIEILISDTGEGIPKEFRSKIFDPFFTTKAVGEGTGLGLSISYGIISKHRGEITFETKTRSESNITGTTFIIRLPIKN